MSNEPIRVLIADDHEVLSSGLRMLLESEGMQVVGLASTGREAIEQSLNLEPDVILLDLAMDDIDGLAALTVIRYHRPEMGVIMLTSHTEPHYAARARSLGADGYLSKVVETENLIEVIQMAACRPRQGFHEYLPVSAEAKDSNGALTQEKTQAIVESLTDKETLILDLVARGYDNQAILDLLCISRNTLKSHLSHIYQKLGVNDRTQAAIWALSNGASHTYENGDTLSIAP